MLNENWVFALNEDEIVDGDKKPLLVNDEKIALIKKENKIYALSNKCPHMECPLSRGKLNDYIIICPCHDWEFDIRTGEFLASKEIKVPIFETKIEDKKIYVNMR